MFLFGLWAAGILFLLFFRNQLTPLKISLLGFPAGISLWTVLVLMMAIFSISMSRAGMYSIAAVYFLAMGLGLAKKGIPVRQLQYLGCYAIVFIFCSFGCTLLNLSVLSSDSWQYIFLGKAFTNPDYLFSSYSQLLSQFPILIPLWQSSSVIFKFSYLYAVFPLLSLNFLILFVFMAADQLQSIELGGKRLWLFGILLIAVMVSCLMFVFHSVYVHSNLISGYFFFFVIITFWLWLKEKKPVWLLLSSLFLVVFSFSRLEAPMFALIIVGVMIGFPQADAKKMVLYFFPVFAFIIGWQWRILQFIRLDSGNNLFSINKFLDSRRVWLVIVLYGMMMLAIFIIHIPRMCWIKANIPVILLYMGSISLLLVLISRGNQFLKRHDQIVMEKTTNLILNLAAGFWGAFWILLFVVLLIAFFYQSRFEYDSFLSQILLNSTLLYFILNILRKGWTWRFYDSGNRMLFYFFFLSLFYAILKTDALISKNMIKKTSTQDLL
jgi:hypothetical protein